MTKANQLNALKELAEKVEAGDYRTMGDTNACAKAFGAHPHPDAQYAINAWNQGSLDAAHSLHKAVVGDRWGIRIWFPNPPDLASVELERAPYATKLSVGKNTVKVIRMPEAKARLLATIKAKIAELEG